VYYIGFNFLITLLFCLVCAPFLLFHYDFTLHSFFWFLITTFFFKATLGILKQRLEFRFQGWKRGLVTALFLVISGTYLQLIVFSLLNQPILYLLLFLILLIVLILLIYQRVFFSGTLLEDISMGQAAKLKFVNVLLMYARTYTKKPITFRTRPWLFRNSELIFQHRTPENALVELCLKSTLRHRAQIMSYLQLIGVYALVLSLFPFVGKWVLWGISIIFLAAIVKLYWLEAVNSPYVALFPLPDETKLGAAGRSFFILSLPGEIILAFLVILQTQKLLYALIILPFGFLLSKFTAKKFAKLSR
jgi:ABC-2 type transport system permease protein